MERAESGTPVYSFLGRPDLSGRPILLPLDKGPVMKLWLQNLAWQLGVALGLIEPPSMQPIPVENDEQRRRLAARQRR
ncbi:TPA: hypothetical protein L5324_000806 [Pseudomonas aeruginosa]|nr:hypothetical protein B8B65_00495 [Pseudomonas aeruginosa]QII95706.1 hypothetical protein F9C43_20525 [Pseudomonas aeruginosa]QLF35440.1 hypothetical protein GNT61_18840 [Pseudomonas aeruginosa]RQE65529.1 hypothetical protein IPC306_14935 [Pseudomonas aeruginosa]RUJ19977.1 hypothetical protein IPC380_15600 [Pseudomonas aeruginosa]